MRKFTSRPFTSLTVAAVMSCAALAGCGEDVVLPNVELANRTTNALSIPALTSLVGSYENCLNRSGNWTYDLMSPPGAQAPTVIKRDTACKLNLLSFNSPPSTFLTVEGPLYMDAAFGTPKIFSNMAQQIFVNARNNKAANFDNAFNLEVLYSDTLEAVTNAPVNTSYTVVTSTLTASRVAAPNLELVSNIDIKVLGDANRSIDTITGGAQLNSAAAAPVDGKYYAIVDSLIPSPTLASVKAAYDGASTKTPVSAPVMLNTFGLAPGSSLATAIDKTVIVANFDASDTGLTTPSFKIFSFHFPGCATGNECNPPPPPPPPPASETEPNNVCTQANAGALSGSLLASLASGTDVDWFFYQATDLDIGKKVHVVTSPGEINTDTVVEVFSGACTAPTSLRGPSDDSGYHENWKSTPITVGGVIFVKVTNSSFGHLGSAYKLTVTYE